MRSIHSWLDEYGESHQNKTNKTIHWVCVPSIMVSLIGLFWSIPVPAFMSDLSPWANWGVVFVLLAMVYYLLLSPALMLGMVFVGSGMLFINYNLAQIDFPLWAISLIIFATAWVGQFIGHKIEGKKPSFFKDLQFLLIGPMWLLSFIYKKVGIRY
jgi:uncharacterized membrane protein YGL010W